MTEKFTPGPWEQVIHEAVNGHDYIQILSGSWDIAHNKYSARDWEEEKANACLIAAAPLLYEALSRVLCLLNGEHDGYIGRTQDGHIAYDRKAIDRSELLLIDALAAARGEE